MSNQQTRPGAAEFVKKPLVYCGRRWIDHLEKMCVAIRPLQDGKLQEEMLFAYDKKAHRVVGGIYEGAEFSDSQARGISGRLSYQSNWPDKSDLIDWKARDEYAESQARCKKLEADAKKVSEIEAIMLPLRMQFDRYRLMRDSAGMKALRSAVMAALECSPRASEK